MTETEAKTKRCCGGAGCGSLVIQEATWEYQTKQLDSFNLLPRMCIGSDCMAWRIHRITEDVVIDGGFPAGSWPQSTRIVGGYCGLCVKP